MDKLEFKSVIEVKNVWAVMNGWLNWQEFIDSNKRVNGDDIPETIVDELLEMML